MSKKEKFVYFIKPVGERGPIKIGCSIMPNGRKVMFQAFSPVFLEVAAETLGTHGHERRLHRYFQAYRRHGEWFEYTGQLRELIQAMKNGTKIDAALLLLPGEAEDYAPRRFAADYQAAVAENKERDFRSFMDRHKKDRLLEAAE